MSTEYKLPYTASEISERLGMVSNTVLYTNQSLTDEQKELARSNIGAQAQGDYVLNTELGALAEKDVISKTDLSIDIQESLDKADNALQSYIETDPTVPAWAKEPNKPTYTASEVGALSDMHNADSEAHTDIRLSIDDLILQTNSKQNKITGTAGQFVVIGEDGNVTTRNIVIAEEVAY